ncbi:hypothetical protein ACFV5N_23920 [Streptomyces sp. NPDC059853]|uniref:hypothetical protein n=1 Tax=Streptomyces sp. NPDC059853 TaxID=3346973 RepID=UPI0036500436
MATDQPTTTKTARVPAVGKAMSVRVDDGMHDDLTVIMRTGCSASDAVRRALLLLANAYDAAWAEGIYPVGEAPQITNVTLAAYRPDPQQ